MARGSFISRIGNAIRNIVAPRHPAPPGRPPPEPPPEQPREREPRGNEYREIWRDGGGKGNYKKNLAVFHSAIDPIESDPAEKLGLWESYIRHINRGEGGFRRQSTSNMFWRDSGIDPQSDAFNWRAWRQAMGYTGKNRSRTT